MYLFVNTDFMLPGVFNGQSKSFGNTSFFVNWDTVGEVAQKLPRSVSDMRILVRYPAKHVQGRDELYRLAGLKEVALTVNPEKLRACLGYLQQKNPRIYMNVSMDNETLESLEQARREAVAMGLDDVFRDWDDAEQRFTTTVNIDPVAPNAVADVLAHQHGPTMITRSGGPVRPHEVPDLLAQCFPSLFPTGAGANYRQFKVPLSTAEMLTHTVQFGDPRFAQHMRYMFMMVNIKNLDMAYRSISATLRGSVKRTNMDGDLEDVTDELLEKIARVV